MTNHERFWALDAGTAETVLRGIEIGLADRPDNAGARVMASDDPGSSMSVRRDSVAVVGIDGPLSRATVTSWWGDVLATGYDAIKSTLAVLLNDPGVSAILLNIDSPGGSVAGVQELADFIADAAKKKPMAAFTNGLMASAAYWLGSSTGRVYATETAEVGSIGVIMTLFDQRRALDKAGLGVHVISSGRLKAAGNPNLELSEEQRLYFQGQADGIHAVFRGSVASRMGLDLEQAEAWGDGQVFLAGAALEKGLVSQVVSGLDEAVTTLSKEIPMDRASLEAKAPELVAELLEEGRAQASSENLQDVFLAAARRFLTDAQAEKLDGFISACTSAHLSREQAEAMMPVHFAAEQQAEPAAGDQAAVEPAPAPADATDAKAILDNLQAQSSHGVPVGADSVTPATLRAALAKAAENYGA